MEFNKIYLRKLGHIHKLLIILLNILLDILLKKINNCKIIFMHFMDQTIVRTN